MPPIWVPGIMEMMVANKEQAEKYPVMAECFEEYTRRRTRLLGPNVPVERADASFRWKRRLTGRIMPPIRGSIYLYRECVEAVQSPTVRAAVPAALWERGCGHLERICASRRMKAPITSSVPA